MQLLDFNQCEACEIPGYPGYLVNRLGEVFSFRALKGHSIRKRLQTVDKQTGYRTVGFCKFGKCKTVKVQWLVALTFIGPRPPGKQVCHNNGNKKDNRLENLRYDTPKGNAADRPTHGTNDGPRGESCAMSKLTREQVIAICELVDAGYPYNVIAPSYDVSPKTISAIATGRTWGWLTGRSPNSPKVRKV